MKVALLGENYYPTLGGIQEHVYHLAQALRSAGHSVNVLTGLPRVESWRGPRDEEWVTRLGRARRYSVMGTSTVLTMGPGVARRLWKALRHERFDLVHVHGPCDVGLPMLLYPMYRGPIVATLHSPINDAGLMRRLAAPYYQWVLNRARRVIAVSETARTAMARYARFTADIVPNGVPVAMLAGGRPMDRLRRDGRKNILMLGRLEPRNGPDLMFAAMERVLERHPSAHLIVAGEERPFGTRRHEAMVPASCRAHVTFLGAVFEERPDVYASADVCVVPARAGTFSIIILEALAAGLPVVATPFIEGHDREPHWRSVVTTPDFRPESIADAISGALSENQTRRIADGREIVRSFDWPVVSKRIESLYREALSG